MSDQIRLFFVQMTSGPDIEQNLDYVEGQLEHLKTSQADMVILPEMFALYGSKEQARLGAQEREFHGPVGKAVRGWAQMYGVWIVAGSIPAVDGDETKSKARCHVVNPAGELVTCYDKIHLFDANVSDKQGAYRESDEYSAGSQVVSFDSPWGRIGLAICYDLRFPELFRKLAEQGARLVVVPAAFTAVTGEAHWEVLCRARAIENGIFLAAVNQTGQHDARRQTWGHSMLVSPWGGSTDMSDTATSKVFTAQLSEVETARNQLPVHQHRRLV